MRTLVALVLALACACQAYAQEASSLREQESAIQVDVNGQLKNVDVLMKQVDALARARNEDVKTIAELRQRLVALEKSSPADKKAQIDTNKKALRETCENLGAKYAGVEIHQAGQTRTIVTKCK